MLLSVICCGKDWGHQAVLIPFFGMCHLLIVIPCTAQDIKRSLLVPKILNNTQVCKINYHKGDGVHVGAVQ